MPTIRADAVFATAGVTLFVLFVATWVLLLTAPFGTLEREAAITVSNSVAWLELVWTAVAIAFALIRWRATTARFRIFLGLNVLVVTVLLWELFAALRAG